MLGVGVAAEAMGVKRKRCIWPLGSAACISCCPGPGMTVTPWGMTCSCPDVCPWPWTITVRVCWLPGTLVCWSTPEQTCCFCIEADKREYMHKRLKKRNKFTNPLTVFLSQRQLCRALCSHPHYAHIPAALWNRFLTNLNELAKLRQGKFDLPLALSSWGACLCLSCSSGAGCTLATYSGNRAGARNCCWNGLATNDLRHHLLSTLAWKTKVCYSAC